jgi:hypothetical protein
MNIGETSARAASHWCQLLSSSGELLVATPCQMRRISVVGGPVLVVMLYLVSMKWVWGYPNMYMSYKYIIIDNIKYYSYIYIHTYIII